MSVWGVLQFGIKNVRERVPRSHLCPDFIAQNYTSKRKLFKFKTEFHQLEFPPCTNTTRNDSKTIYLCRNAYNIPSDLVNYILYVYMLKFARVFLCKQYYYYDIQTMGEKKIKQNDNANSVTSQNANVHKQITQFIRLTEQFTLSKCFKSTQTTSTILKC